MFGVSFDRLRDSLTLRDLLHVVIAVLWCACVVLLDVATDADIVRHVRSSRFTSLLAILEAAHEPPRVQFDFVTATRGLDYVAEVRHEVWN